MAFHIYYNDTDFQGLVTVLTAASNDSSLSQQQRNQISNFLSAGISAYTSAPLLPVDDPRATGDPACRDVTVNTNKTPSDFLTAIQTFITKNYAIGNVALPFLTDLTWFGAIG